VAVCGRRQERLDETAAEVAAAGGECLAKTCDIREPDQIAALCDAVLERFGRIDVLVNNAGGQFPVTAESLKPKGWDAVIRNNLSGTWYMTQAAATRAMIPNRHVASSASSPTSRAASPAWSTPGPPAPGVENMTARSRSNGPSSASAPSRSRRRHSLVRHRQYPPELLEAARVRTPAKRLGNVDEVAHCITYLASRPASFITGATLYMDGGASLWGDNWQIP